VKSTSAWTAETRAYVEISSDMWLRLARETAQQSFNRSWTWQRGVAFAKCLSDSCV